MRILNIAALAGAAVFVAGAASGDTPLPHQRLGLWDSSMTVMGRPMTTESCIDAASESKMSALSASIRQKRCKSGSIRHNADGSWTSISSCEFVPGKVMKSRSVVSGDFNSRVNITVYADGDTTPKTAITMTYMGACKPGMKGGDVVMSNGVKMNVIDGTMSGLPK
jgi:hypothetical protein